MHTNQSTVACIYTDCQWAVLASLLSNTLPKPTFTHYILGDNTTKVHFHTRKPGFCIQNSAADLEVVVWWYFAIVPDGVARMLAPHGGRQRACQAYRRKRVTNT